MIGAAVMITFWRSIDQHIETNQNQESSLSRQRQNAAGEQMQIERKDSSTNLRFAFFFSAQFKFAFSGSFGGLFTGLIFLIGTILSIYMYSFVSSNLVENNWHLLVRILFY